MKPRLVLALALCVFVSGAAGLVHQLAWIRTSSLILGSTTFALSTVLAVFFLGLALGSALAGARSPSIARPLRLYALLELALALVVPATLPLFGWADALFGAAYRALPASTLLVGLIRAAIIALVLLPPTALMGATLPLLCRAVVSSPLRIAGPVGIVYALNTLGAAAGCLLAGFVLIPELGVTAAILVGASGNLAVGLVALALFRNVTAVTHSDTTSEPEASMRRRPLAAETGEVARDSRSGSPALGTLFGGLVLLAGAVALSHEVLWTRFLTLVVRSSTHTYTLTLAAVLVGIVLGSLCAPLLFDRRLPRARVFGALQVLIGLAVLFVMTLPPALWIEDGLPAGTSPSGQLGTIFAVLLVPAILAGASFPLAVRMVADDPVRAGVAVGRVAALNTFGGILGALLTGFLVLPHLGLERSIVVTTGSSVTIGIATWLALDRAGAGGTRRAATLAGASVLLWVALLVVPSTRLPEDFLGRHNHRLLAFREGLEANVAVVEREDASVHMEIDGWWQGRRQRGHQVVAAHLPMLFHDDPESVLVVGVGVGQTPSRFLMHDIERLDCVDIEPSVFDLIATHFPAAWMDDPRVRLRREDGRNVINHANDTYDVISLELGQLFRPGVGAFYSVEFYEKARARLRPGGILSQFVPLPFLPPETLKSVIASFVTVFPESVLWYNTSELLLLGANAPRIGLQESRLRQVLVENETVREDLHFAYWGGDAYRLDRPDIFLGGFLGGPSELAAIAGDDVERLHDDRPVLEHLSPTGADETGRPYEIGAAELIRAHLGSIEAVLVPEPAGDLELSLETVATVRDRNLADVVAAAWLRQMEDARAAGDLGRVDALLEAALEANPENALARRLLADASVLHGRLEEAATEYESVLRDRPDDALAHRGLAFALHRLGRVERAIPHYRAALELRPGDAEAHNNLGAALGQQGDTAGARHHFEAALRARPDHTDALRNLRRLDASRREEPTDPR